MRALSNDFERPVRKARRAGKAAVTSARSTADAVAEEARTFGLRSAKQLKAGAAKQTKHAMTVRSAGEDAADIARQRLQNALEALQATSADVSRWAGAKASEAKDQAGELVRERPVGSLAAMLAIGALIGLVTSLALRAD